MNKMHEAAKIAFAILGIHFLVGLLRTIGVTVSMVMSRFSLSTIGMALFSLIVTLICAYAVIYFLIIKRGWLADKIVSADQEIASDTPDNWLPAAYRLVVFIIALIFLRSVLWNISLTINSIITTQGFAGYSGRYMKEMILKLIFTLPVTIYLLCGAPHFVRWQIKKTTEFCKQLETENANNPNA